MANHQCQGGINSETQGVGGYQEVVLEMANVFVLNKDIVTKHVASYPQPQYQNPVYLATT